MEPHIEEDPTAWHTSAACHPTTPHGTCDGPGPADCAR